MTPRTLRPILALVAALCLAAWFDRTPDRAVMLAVAGVVGVVVVWDVARGRMEGRRL